MGIDGLEQLTDDGSDLEKLAQLVRATLKTEDDYYTWKTTGAWAVIQTCTVIDKNPQYKDITDSQMSWVVRRVGELIVDL